MFHFIKKYGLEGGSLYTKHDTNDGTIVVYNRDQYTTSVKTFVTTLFTKLKEWLSSMYLVFAK